MNTESSEQRILAGNCEKCGGDLRAENVDPDSVLSYPMRFIWTCEQCEHVEVKDVR